MIHLHDPLENRSSLQSDLRYTHLLYRNQIQLQSHDSISTPTAEGQGEEQASAEAIATTKK